MWVIRALQWPTRWWSYNIEDKVHHFLSDNAPNMIKGEGFGFKGLDGLYAWILLSAFRDYNGLLSEEQSSREDGDNDEESNEEEDDEEELEKLSHHAEIAAVERRVHELEELMKLSPEGRDPVTQAFRLPCSAHKVIICLCLYQNIEQFFII